MSAGTSTFRLATLLLALLLPGTALAKGYGAPVSYPLAPDVGSPSEVASGDFNGDKHVDLVVSSAVVGAELQCFLSIFLGNGDGTLQTPFAISTGDDNFRSMIAYDFDHDGNLDLAGAHRGTITILFGNGDGTFKRSQIIAVTDRADDLVLADLNGDGRPDWAVNFVEYSAEVLIAQPGGGYLSHALEGISALQQYQANRRCRRQQRRLPRHIRCRGCDF